MSRRLDAVVVLVGFLSLVVISLARDVTEEVEDASLRQRVAELEAHNKDLKAHISGHYEMLTELHKKMEDPKLLEWIHEQKEKVSKLLAEHPEANALIESVHQVGEEDLGTMEKFVEKEIESYVGSQYLPVVAWTLSLAILSVPLMVSFYGLMRISQRLSVRQFILVGNFLNMAITLILCLVGVITGADPLSSLQAISQTNFVVVQLLVALVFVLFCLLLGSSIALAETNREKDIFVAQLCFYLLMAAHYQSIVWHPAMLGSIVSPLWIWYPTYAGIFLGMTFLTAIVGAINSRNPSLLDLENNGEKHE